MTNASWDFCPPMIAALVMTVVDTMNLSNIKGRPSTRMSFLNPYSNVEDCWNSCLCLFGPCYHFYSKDDVSFSPSLHFKIYSIFHLSTYRFQPPHFYYRYYFITTAIFGSSFITNRWEGDQVTFAISIRYGLVSNLRLCSWCLIFIIH